MSNTIQNSPPDTQPTASNNNRTDHITQEEADAIMESVPANRRRGPFYALTFRNFRLFFVGQLISVAGTWMQTVAQNWLVWDLTKDARWLGIVSGASALPYVAFAIWGGQVADRFPRRATLVITQSVAMILAFLQAILAVGWWVPLQAWHIAVLSGLLGVVNAFNMPAQQAFVTDMVSDREALGNAIALNSLRFNIARFLGPILAGAVLVKFSAAACFTLNGLSYIAVIISLLMMRLKPFVYEEKQVNFWEGFTYIWRARSILRVTVMVGAASLLAWSISSTLFPVLADRYGQKAAGYSSMMAVNGIGAALGAAALALFGDRIPRRGQVYGGAVLFCIGLLLLAVAPTFLLALACLMFGGFAMIVFGMSSNIKVQEEVPDALRGRVMAVYSLVFQGMMPIGGMELGFLAQHLSAAAAIGVNAGLCLLISLALYGWSLIDRASSESPPVSS